MKIALLANWSSIHTVRWANALAERGHEVHLLTAHRTGERLHESVRLHLLPFRPPYGYYLNVPFLWARLRSIRPALLNVHYASGYGTLGRLCGFHPLLLSVWGSDVYDYPYASAANMRRVVRNLRAADWVCSTSHAMAAQTRRLVSDLPGLSITPFGVDLAHFTQSATPPEESGAVVVGTVKVLAHKYGIDTLIRGFGEALARVSDQVKLKLLIVGDGPQRADLEKLVDELGLRSVTEFTGRVLHAEVPEYLRRMGLYVAVSRLDSESFGVAVLEASACGLPVIVSNVGGLPEVVESGVTGLIVEREDPQALAEAILKLAREAALRLTMGAAGRESVSRRYSWDASVRTMEDVYRKVGG